MFKQIYEYTRDILTISREVQENKSDIKDAKTEIRELRKENKILRDNFSDLLLIVQKLSFDIQQVTEREKSEREKIILQLENEILKFERRLPEGKDSEK